MTDPIARANELSSEGKTYAEIAKSFNREGVHWDGEERDWSRGDIENLMSHGSPEGASATDDGNEAAANVDDADAAGGDTLVAAGDEAATEPTPLAAPAKDRDEVDASSEEPSQAVAGPPSDLPKRNWHDRKWLLVAVASIVGVLLGVGIAAPDRQAARDERTEILADAKSDASDIKSDARDDADEMVEDAKKEKADLLESIEAAKDELADVQASIQTAQADLAKTERTRANKQKEVNSLNRAIRASTSLSRENAVETARNYLENQSFSCQGLIDQLEYEQYSNSDATYAAKQVGLC